MPFFETSAKEGKGVGALFENILDKLNEPPVLLNQNVSESSNEIVSKKAKKGKPSEEAVNRKCYCCNIW